MKATSELMKEHEGIMLMLSAMQKVADDIDKGLTLDTEHLEKIVEFLRVFADKCHHGKEEGILFPELVKNGFSNESGPIAVMLDEHRLGRGFIKKLSEDLQAYSAGSKEALPLIAADMKQYVDLLTTHIQKENMILFPMADRALSEEVQNQLYEQYEKLEEEVIGVGKHEEFHSLLRQLRQAYLEPDSGSTHLQH
jgi:hemerythrin-like domain-containing protein